MNINRLSWRLWVRAALRQMPARLAQATVLLAAGWVAGVWPVHPGGLCAVAQVPSDAVQDLSLLVTPKLPCVWPVGMTPMAVVPQRRLAPYFYRRELIVIDEHTGTQWDAPAHFVPPPDSGAAGAGPNGLITSEKVPAWQFGGEACVIDVTAHRDDALAGSSFLIRPDTVVAWEKANRPLRAGDVVLFRSDYTDSYYLPFPKGERFVATALAKDTPGWPAPTPETMAYLNQKGVMTLGLDGASMGPLPDMAVATHQAGGKLGMVWTECATNLSSLPTTGAFYCMLAAKHVGGSGGECRSIGVTDLKLAARLIACTRAKRVADLSVTLDENYPITWPGRTPGAEASRYVGTTLNAFSPARGPYFARTHMLDGQAGTHVVLPGFSLPLADDPPVSDVDAYSAAASAFAKAVVDAPKESPTAATVPLAQLMGEAIVIDVRSLVGTTSQADWPASPAISVDLVKKHEAERGDIHPGDVVIFWSGYSDAHYKPMPATPEVDRLFAAPLQGKVEGWPAVADDTVIYLAEKGVRCIGTDSPTLGGVNEEHAIHTYWQAAKHGLLPVEYLTNVESIAGKKAFFIFAPIKIDGSYGGYGRALAYYE